MSTPYRSCPLCFRKTAWKTRCTAWEMHVINCAHKRRTSKVKKATTPLLNKIAQQKATIKTLEKRVLIDLTTDTSE